jgi:hypothetical protein
MVELLAPPGVTKAVTIRVKITPPTGSVLIYGAPGYNKPIKFHGPQQVGSIATNSPIVKVEMVDGATAWEIETMGYQIDR